jgi:hypothetical protein
MVPDCGVVGRKKSMPRDVIDSATQGPDVEGLTRTFEDILTGIRHESYRSRQMADRLWEAALGANCRHRFKEPLCEEAKEVATVSFAVCLASKALSLLRDNNAITYSQFSSACILHFITVN